MKLKKRYLLTIAGTLLLGALGVKNPERVVAIINDGYTAAQGHSSE